MRSSKIYIPNGIGELRDQLAMMMLKAPKFVDKTGYFPNRNIDTVFNELNEGLNLVRVRLGEELYMKLTNMSAQMRAYFEADPEDKTGDSIKGRIIIEEMRDLLKSVRKR